MVDLQQYTALETRDAYGTLTIALLRKEAIRPVAPEWDGTADEALGKSWYLTSYPVQSEVTASWYTALVKACALRRGYACRFRGYTDFADAANLSTPNRQTRITRHHDASRHFKLSPLPCLFANSKLLFVHN